jgi:hypothetical protein
MKSWPVLSDGHSICLRSWGGGVKKDPDGLILKTPPVVYIL